MSEPAVEKPQLRRPPRTMDTRRDYLRVLVYGRPGVGKTTFAATGPGPVLYFNLEDGLSSVKRADANFAAGVGFNQEDLYDYRLTSYKALRSAVDRTRAELVQDPTFWGTLVVDTVSAMQALIQDEVKIERSGQKEDTRAEFRELKSRTMAAIRALVKLPVSLVLIAHEKSVEKEVSPRSDKTQEHIGTNIVGASAEDISGLLDLTARLFLEHSVTPGTSGKGVTIERRLLCHPKLFPAVIEAKCREPRLGEIENPNLKHLLAKCNGEQSA